MVRREVYILPAIRSLGMCNTVDLPSEQQLKVYVSNAGLGPPVSLF